MVIGIIEDDTLLRKALDTSLQNKGYTTILAGSRKEAIKNIDSSVDLLIITLIVLGSMNSLSIPHIFSIIISFVRT